MKSRKLSILIAGSMLFTGAVSTSFAQSTPPWHVSQRDECSQNAKAGKVSGNSNFQDESSHDHLLVSDSDYPGNNVGSSEPSKTRGQVLAELKEAQEKGLLDFNDSNYAMKAGATDDQPQPGKTWAQVVAETEEARAQGLLSFNDSEYPAYQNSGRTNGSSQIGMASANSSDTGTRTC